MIKVATILEAFVAVLNVLVNKRSGNTKDTLERSNMGVSSGYIFKVVLAGIKLFKGFLKKNYILVLFCLYNK